MPTRAIDRLARLQELTAALARSADEHEIARLVVGQVHDALGASASVLYARAPGDEDEAEGAAASPSPGAGTFVLLAERGMPPSRVEELRTLPLHAPLPLSTALLTRAPVWLEDREALLRAYPSVAQSRVDPAQLQAAAALPLLVEGRAIGGLALSFAAPQAFDAVSRDFLSALAQHCALALDRARLHQQARAAADRLAFLAEASRSLAASLDYQQALQTIAELAVPRLADWCTIDVTEDADPAAWQVAVAHAEPDRAALLREVRRRYPPGRLARHTTLEVQRSGVSRLAAEVSEAALAAASVDEEHLGLMRAIGVRSLLSVPLRAAAGVIGVLHLGCGASGRRFGQADLALAEEIGHRAGVAIENAALYRDARRALRAREEFLALAAHELRTPLSAARLRVAQLMRDPTPERLGERIEALDRTLGRLVSLSEALLDLSALDAGKIDLATQDVDLAALAAELLEDERETLRRAGCAVLLDAAAPVRGRWDRMRVEQVLRNLLSNAVRYGCGTPIDLTVERAGDEARVVVRDYGPGVAPADRERIFAKFERASSARNHGGLGLGLWLSRRLIEAMGGSLALDSGTEPGACFVLRLPLAGG